MLEITGNDIAALNDEDLRTLVGLLCEAELRKRALPTSAVTYGGNQTAEDGGLDVRVALPPATVIDGFIPRPATGFQAKKQDMPRSEILKEMQPFGTLRAIIQELADTKGAYVIVSSDGSTTDSALRSRREAMRSAVAALPNGGDLTLEFYDRTRLATWVGDHAGLIPWVRQRIGKALQGWQAYGAWAYPAEDASAEYLLDDKLRVKTGKKDDGGGFSAVAGVNRIRDSIRESASVVRMVGLSGVGKTRFVQALFDDRVGEKSLPPSLALYTNMSDGPEPTPLALATNLIAARTRAILVVDNCPPDLHRRLSEVGRSKGSTISVLTVEYDIRDDEPEGTEVFALEPSSDDLLQALIKQRYTHLSNTDAQSIATFSGGNARIAIALAETVRNNETIAGLSDAELFGRLFEQRHGADESLLAAAEACSLVYSFEGENLEGEDAELPRLGNLIGRNANEVFAKVAALKRRDLVQQRSVWRAVLPHAIANRLAAMALQNIPRAVIDGELVNGAPIRLLRSFSRRLGYLDSSKEAVKLVESWLALDGHLGKVEALDEHREAMLRNVAPVAPESVLAAIEPALASPEGLARCHRYVRLIRSIAYDAATFERAAALLIKLAENDAVNDGKAADAFDSLFFLYLSGTHATIEQRLSIIEALITSGNAKRRDLGIAALRSVLEYSYFSSTYSFEFGARSRDYGYWPKTQTEIDHWLASALRLAETFATSNLDYAADVRGVLANKFRGLWTRAQRFDDLERISTGITAKGFWREGWIAVHGAQRQAAKEMTPAVTARLDALERLLRPKDLIEKVRAIVLTQTLRGLDLDDFDGTEDSASPYERAEQASRRLGEDLAKDEASFRTLLPELVSTRGRLWSLGQGLATTPDVQALWDRLVAQLASTPVANRNVHILQGILNGLVATRPDIAGLLLDAAIDKEPLAEWFPILQAAIPIDPAGVARLKRSLATGKTPIERHSHLMLGGATGPIAGGDMKELTLLIADQPGGLDVAVDILSMRLHFDKDKKHEHHEAVLSAGRELLRRTEFDQKDDRQDHDLGSIARASLVGEEGASVAKELSLKLRESVGAYKTSAFHHNDLLKGLMAVQPMATLDGLFGGEAKVRARGFATLEDLEHLHRNPLDGLPDEVVIAWCKQQPTTRYPIMAKVVRLTDRPDEKAALQWSGIALSLLDQAPDKIAVLKVFTKRFLPMSWSGSRAALVEANAKLLDALDDYPDAALVALVLTEKTRLAAYIDAEKRSEALSDRATDERFE